MRNYSLTHLSDTVLLRDLTALAARDRETLAELLAHIAEVDARRLYLSAGTSCMHAYCVERLHLSEGAAFKRIRAARAARRHPQLFDALSEGRIHLAGVCLLAPLLNPENVDELMTAATHRRKSEIELYLAKRFPMQAPNPWRQVATLRAMPSVVVPRVATSHVDLLSPGTVDDVPGRRDPDPTTQASSTERTPRTETGDTEPGSAPGTDRSSSLSPGTVAREPSVSERFLLRLVLDKETHDKLRYAQELLGHAVPCGDLARVLGRALDSLIPQLERKKFGANMRKNQKQRSRKGEGNRPASTAAPVRYIPAAVRRAVWKRDGGQCTFVGTDGHRCRSRKRLEYDHVMPFARGGASTVDGLRLRCRAHNQLEAESAFGVEFMKQKRQEARLSERLGAVAP